MPTYDYVCSKCGHQLEAFQSMKDRPLRKCPACGRLTLKRQLGAGAGLIFKGSGFYITDYKKAASPKAESGGESKPAESPKKSEAKPTAAPAKT